jgi:YaiO family outer membrane protein
MQLRHWFFLLLFLSGMLYIAPASGQANRSSQWTGWYQASTTTYSGDRPLGHRHQISLQRKWAGLSAGIALGHVRRFGLEGTYLAGESYPRLWDKAYGHIRFQVAPSAQILPRMGFSLELFQGLGNGWEGSAGVRHVRSTAPPATIYHTGLARYAGPWYVRGRITVVPYGGVVGTSGTLSVRRYTSPNHPYNLVELAISQGREVEWTGGQGLQPIVVIRSLGGVVRVQRLIGFGLTLSAGIRIIRNTFYAQRGLDLAVSWRT